MNLWRDPVVVLLVSILLGWGVWAGSQAPQPLGADVPDTEFSGVRAEALLRLLYRDDQPHVAGSPQNAALRDRIMELLKSFGYEPEIQSRFQCRPEEGMCSPVENILAVKKGTGMAPAAANGKTLLLMAHYDSTWAGPGLADDGSGVAAVLEIARMAFGSGAFGHDVIFLLTDAEEQGLLGAEAFVKHHELFPSVGALINLDARGASGPSMMFETGPGNRGVIRMLAKNLDRPVANSLSYEFYQRMPNDTDFTPFREHGLAGVNFAFTRHASVYHSRIDDLQRLDMASLQHHGQNAWAMLQALDDRRLEKLKSDEDAAYIDLFGTKMLQYPFSSAAGLVLVLGILAMVAIRRSFPQQVRFRQVLWTLLGVAFLLTLLVLAGYVVSWPLGRWVDMHPLEHAFPWLGRSALLLISVWVVFEVLRWLAPRATQGSVTFTCWGLFLILGLTLAQKLPSASVMVVLPLLGFTLGLVLDAFRWKKPPRLLFATLGGFLGAAYIGLYGFFALDVVFNFEQGHIRVVPLILPMLAVLPVLLWNFEQNQRTGRFGTLMLFLLLCLCVGQRFVPAYTGDVPRDMSLMLHQEQGAERAWLVLDSAIGKPDRRFAEESGFAPMNLPAWDGESKTVLGRSIEPVALPPLGEIRISPQDADLVGKRNHNLLEMDIPPGVQWIAFNFPRSAGFSRALVNGQLAAQFNAASEDPGHIIINHPPVGRLRIEFETTAVPGFDLLITARHELPEELIASLRDDWPEDAQPAFRGPRALQIQRLRIGGPIMPPEDQDSSEQARKDQASPDQARTR